jgi:hypothetical protein
MIETIRQQTGEKQVGEINMIQKLPLTSIERATQDTAAIKQI